MPDMEAPLKLSADCLSQHVEWSGYLEMMQLADRLGYRHLIFGVLAPYDVESVERIATEIRPKLPALIG